MPRLIKTVFALIACLNLSQALADPDDYEEWLMKVGDYQTLYKRWYDRWAPGAFAGNAEDQEGFANLLLGPHGNKFKHQPHEGLHYLYLAAIGGRRGAMLRLADASDKGELGTAKRPMAAKCWSKAPSDFEGRIKCVELTAFRDRSVYPACGDLLRPVINHMELEFDGTAYAKLCLANNTPALLEPGLPPSERTLQRIREYGRHGIALIITGDVYYESFERFRFKFNTAMSEAIDKAHGQGYLNRLEKDITARIATTGTATR